MRAFHGTDTAEKRDSILREGFREGTWFALDIRDAVRFGGRLLFEAEFNAALFSEDVDWQFHILAPLPVSAIVRVSVGPERKRALEGRKERRTNDERGH